MSKKQQIQDYLRSISRHMVNITDEQATEIIRIATAVPGTPGIAYCKLYRWNGVKPGWEIQRIVEATDQKIQWAIVDAINARITVENCYLWECYGSDGALQGKIYTVNPTLF